MKNLIKIRFLQLYRELVKAGWWASFVGMILYFFIVIKITQSSVLPPTPDQFAISFSFIIWGLHSIRKDKRTLSVILPNNIKQFYFLEYSVFSFPYIIPLIYHGDYIGILLFYCSIIVTIILDISIDLGNKKKTVWLSKFIEKDNFEWLAGMRKVQYPVLGLYIFCLTISYWHFAGFICLGIITLSFSEYYSECESQVVLTLKHETSKLFIQNKLKIQTIQYLKFVLPILLVYFIHYPEKWIFYLPLTIVYLSNYWVYILNKYKSFQPNQTLRANVIYVVITFIGMFIPYCFPISLIMIFRFYPKAIQNLKPYFHA
jgi:hypothetical protein